MKINDQIINYLAGNMDLSEKAEFEKLISTDPDIKLKIEEYKRNLNSIMGLSSVEEENSYFKVLLPKVRERIESGEKPRVKYGIKIAFSIPVILILAFWVYKQFILSGIPKTTDIQTVISKMNDTAKVELLTGFVDKNSLNDLLLEQDSNQVLSEAITRELLKNKTVSNNQEVIPVDDYDLINDLSRDEAELVYKNLINKKIM